MSLALVKLSIKVKPNAKQTAWQGVEHDVLRLALKAPPVDGAANAELIRFLAKEFKIPQVEIIIKQGLTSRIKVVQLPLTQKVKEFLQTIQLSPPAPLPQAGERPERG